MNTNPGPPNKEEINTQPNEETKETLVGKRGKEQVDVVDETNERPTKKRKTSQNRRKTKTKKKFNAVNKRDPKGRFLPLIANDASLQEAAKERNPLWCCSCEQIRTKAQFSSKYQVHANNIEKYEKFLGKKLQYGPMCNKCYMSWSHYKKVGHKAYHSRRQIRKNKRKKGLHCVLCKQKSPEVSFSNSYYVHENNIERYRKIFKDIQFGELCNKCYQYWYKKSKANASVEDAEYLDKDLGFAVSQKALSVAEIMCSFTDIIIEKNNKKENKETSNETQNENQNENQNQNSNEAPKETPNEAPNETPNETLNQAPNETPKVSNEAPNMAPKAPNKEPNETQNEVPNKTPDEVPSNQVQNGTQIGTSNGTTPNESPNEAPTEVPNKAPNETPNVTTNVLSNGQTQQEIVVKKEMIEDLKDQPSINGNSNASEIPSQPLLTELKKENESKE